MQRNLTEMLKHYHAKWELTPHQEPFSTHSSILQRVIYKKREAMLKIAKVEEEKTGNNLMLWLNGNGVAHVWKHDEDAILMEYISSDEANLLEMANNRNDDEASQIICKVADSIHQAPNGSTPQLVSLETWFSELWNASQKHQGILTESAKVARELLDNQRDKAILHGDLHHQNILYSSERGWLAIDPKGLYGERAFDYANILCNPNKDIALSEGRFLRQVDIISDAVQLDKKRFIQWILAWCGLSASWMLNDGEDASLQIELAQTAFEIL